MRDGDEEKDPPTSHCDLLVVVAVDKGQRGREQHTNELLWLWWLAKGRESDNDTPTSHRDLLVVLVVDNDTLANG